MTAVTLRRKKLGRALRDARVATGMSREAVAEHLEVSVSTVAQRENGTRGIRVRDLKELLKLYSIPTETWEPLIELARAGNETTWWTKALVRDSFMSYIALETDASSVEEYSSTLIPGLAQTRDYARGVMDAGLEGLDEPTIQSRVEVRLTRAELLDRPELPLKLHLVLDEGAVQRQVGGVDVWRAQLQHLVELSKKRNVTIQVIPYSVGAHASMLGGFTLLNFPDADDPAIVYEERLTGDVLTQDPDPDAADFRLLFDRLRTSALPPELSIELIKKVANESR